MLTALLSEAAPLDLRILGRMLIQAAVVGAAAGVLAAAFYWTLELGSELFLDVLAGVSPARAAGEMADKIQRAKAFRPWVLVLLPAAGALLASLLTRRFAPECSGAGENAVIRAVHHEDAQIRRRVIWVKPLATVLTLATGGSGGREGPTAQLSAAVGSTVARIMRLSARERRILLVAGAAAGTAAIFRTPLGAALLAVEVLYRDDFEAEALIPAVLASVVGYSVFISLFGEATLFAVAAEYPFVPGHLPLYGLLAVLLALVAAAYVRALRGVERLSSRLPAWARAGLGGLVVGALATTVCLATRSSQDMGILGGGYGAAQAAITGASWLADGAGAVQLLLLLCAAKILAASFTVGTGASAGVFGPTLAIGALLGGAYGRTLQLWLDYPGIQPGAFALVGMGAFYGGIAHAPLGAIVMVCEMAGSYDLLVPLMLAEGIAFVALRKFTLYPAQVPTKQDSPAHKPRALEVLKDIRVRAVVVSDRPFLAFAPATPVTEVIQEVSKTTWQDVFPVLDEDDKLMGMITPELLRILAAERELEPWILAADAMRPPLTVHIDDDLRAVSRTMIDESLREVPVVDDEGHIIGFVDEAEIAQTYLQATRGDGGGSTEDS